MQSIECLPDVIVDDGSVELVTKEELQFVRLIDHEMHLVFKPGARLTFAIGQRVLETRLDQSCQVVWRTHEDNVRLKLGGVHKTKEASVHFENAHIATVDNLANGALVQSVVVATVLRIAYKITSFDLFLHPLLGHKIVINAITFRKSLVSCGVC